MNAMARSATPPLSFAAATCEAHGCRFQQLVSSTKRAAATVATMAAASGASSAAPGAPLGAAAALRAQAAAQAAQTDTCGKRVAASVSVVLLPKGGA